jgi:hypothetical protein
MSTQTGRQKFLDVLFVCPIIELLTSKGVKPVANIVNELTSGSVMRRPVVMQNPLTYRTYYQFINSFITFGSTF